MRFYEQLVEFLASSSFEIGIPYREFALFSTKKSTDVAFYMYTRRYKFYKFDNEFNSGNIYNIFVLSHDSCQ